jgi:hypothetical protein
MTVTIKYPRIQEQLNKANPPERFGLCDPDWVYVPAAATDVTKTWRKHGWTPLEENKESNDE